jgi:hypothetical protein
MPVTLNGLLFVSQKRELKPVTPPEIHVLNTKCPEFLKKKNKKINRRKGLRPIPIRILFPVSISVLLPRNPPPFMLSLIAPHQSLPTYRFRQPFPFLSIFASPIPAFAKPSPRFSGTAQFSHSSPIRIVCQMLFFLHGVCTRFPGVQYFPSAYVVCLQV